MGQRIQIFAVQQGATAAASIGMVFHHFIYPLDRQQLLPGSLIATLAAAFAVTVFSLYRRLKPGPIAGGRLGGVTRAAADLPRRMAIRY